MKVTYEVKEGCFKGKLDHVVIVDDGLLRECENDKEREELIQECVQRDFEENVSWEITGRENE